MPRRPSLRTIAIILLCLSPPALSLIDNLVSVGYLTLFSDQSDVKNGYAFIWNSQLIMTALFIAVTMIVIGLIVAMYRRDGNISQAKLPLALFVSLVLLGIGNVVLNLYVSQLVANDEYYSSNRLSPNQIKSLPSAIRR